MTRSRLILCFLLGSALVGCDGAADPIDLVPTDGQKADGPGATVLALDGTTTAREVHVACLAGRACSTELSVRRALREPFAGDDLYVASLHVVQGVGGAAADFEYHERRPTHDDSSIDSWVLLGAPSHTYGITIDADGDPRIYLRSDAVAEKFVITIARPVVGDGSEVALDVGAVWR